MVEGLPVRFDSKMAKLRHQALRSIRAYFDQADFTELETPYLLLANAPDPYIDPICITTHAGRQEHRQLHTSPEIWLKRGLAMGLERVYEIARVFRDDPLDKTHSKEFTMLEWYRTQGDLTILVRDCEALFGRIHAEFYGDMGTGAPPFLHAHLNDLFRQHAKIDLRQILNQIADGQKQALQQALLRQGDLLPQNASFSEAMSHALCKYIEPNLSLDRPVVLSGFPAQMAALAELDRNDPLFCDRFEIYFFGLEIANAYQECNDPDEITRRFYAENQERAQLGKAIFPIDPAFIADLGKLRKTAGIALGVDRLLMAITKNSEIGSVQLGS